MRVKTKNEIEACFTELLKENSFDDISISQIADSTGISRSTFYQYYKDKYELLDHMCNELFMELIDGNEIDETETFIKNLQENKVIALNIFHSGCQSSFIQHLSMHIQHLRERKIDGRETDSAEEIICQSKMLCCWCITGFLFQWLNDGLPHLSDMIIHDICLDADNITNTLLKKGMQSSEKTEILRLYQNRNIAGGYSLQLDE